MMKVRFMTLVIMCFAAVMSWAQSLDYPTERVDGYLVYKYPVEKSIGIYRICKNFNIKEEELVKWNPQLKERGVQVDEILYIPVVDAPHEEITPNSEPTTQSLDVMDTVMVIEAAREERAESPFYRIDLIMPFHNGNTPPTAQEERLIEFYRGVVMALNDVRLDADKKIEFYVHNSGTDTTRVAQLLRDSAFYGTDAIIGPFHPEQVRLMSDWIKENKVPTLLPVSSDLSLMRENPYLMYFNSTVEQEQKALVEYILSSDQKINCVFINSDNVDQENQMIRDAIVKSNISKTSIQASAVLHDSLAYALRANAENIIFFPTNKYRENRAYIAKAETLKNKYGLSIFGLFSWLKEQINLPLIYTSTFTTEQEADMTQYDKNWQKYFNLRHAVAYPRYDLLGYDLTRYILGQFWGKTYPGMQSDIYFEPYCAGGAQINGHVEILKTE